MNKKEVLDHIEKVGIVPAVRLSTAEDARFAADAVCHGGIPIVEITMTVPGAVEVIADLTKYSPELVVGAGSLFDLETAGRCLDAGASFLTSPGFDLALVDFAIKKNVAVLAGALTPTEITGAWRAGADFVKVFPCSQVGGESYIKAMKRPFPQVRLIAAGGVNQKTACNFIINGACAIGVGEQLVPQESIRLRQEERIHELARRFIKSVKTARARVAAATHAH
jgi:2-dehydro-3-deoxyphosphogluconate aldolase / (4S)-4-hydroxy-2-oxoglutarate aldolase